jgi:GNAT superfamily N-acetyltransferase
MAGMELAVGGRALFRTVAGELLAVYQEVYAADLADPFFALPRYRQRLEGYAARDGFSLALGRLGGHLVGYALGYPLPAGTAWWEGLRTPADPGLSAEDGRRTFGVNEIMVRAPWRRRGYARRLHDALLHGRPEQRATLLVLPGNAPAQAAYAGWGWRKVGELQPFPDAPRYDAMILTLAPA